MKFEIDGPIAFGEDDVVGFADVVRRGDLIWFDPVAPNRFMIRVATEQINETCYRVDPSSDRDVLRLVAEDHRLSHTTTRIPSVNDYFALDGEAVSRFNARHRGTNYELQVARGPSYGSGDLEAARVILLYANGGYDPKVDKLKPVEFSVPGWPLTWLSPESATVHPGAHQWLSSRLRWLVELYGAQFIAQHVANLNIVPWSSTQYHAKCLLPSREVQLRLARAAAARGAVLVAIRARKAWEPVLKDYPDQVVFVRNPRSSHISPGNLGKEGWQRVLDALGSVPAVV